METMETTSRGPAVRWRPLAALLATGTFVIGTDAYVIAGVLPEVADSLRISVAEAGQLVTVFAIGYTVFAPVLAATTARWPRRVVLITALAVFALGNVGTALAPTFALVLATRVVAAAGAAMFTPNAGVAAAALAGEEHRGQAFSMVTAGLSSSLVLGAPLGTAIGNAFGWRATMWFVALLAVAVAPVLALRLPDVHLAAGPELRERLAPLRDRRVIATLGTTVLAFVGIFIPYTYISEAYAPVTEGHGTRLTVLLLTFGIAGTIGNLAAGRLSDRHDPWKVVVAATLTLALTFTVVVGARESLVAVVPLVIASGALSWSVLTPQQHRLVAMAPPQDRTVVLGLNAAAVYLGVSLSGSIGALALDALGPARFPLLASAFLVIAAASTWISKASPTASA